MKNPVMFEYGLKYRLKSLEQQVIKRDKYPCEGFKEAVEADKELILEAFYQRDKYIKHLEKQIADLHKGIVPALNLYHISNPLISRSNGKAFAVAKTGEEAIEKVRDWYSEQYSEAVEEGFLENLRAEKILENIHVDDIHISPIFYF
jgi:hypothetical protein